MGDDGWRPAAPGVDVAASLASLRASEHVQADGMLKLTTDLLRYQQVIETTRPQVLVETGTRTGASARWFAERVAAVLTVDVLEAPGQGLPRVTCLQGDSADPRVARRVARWVDGRRAMVSLDSDHSGQ